MRPSPPNRSQPSAFAGHVPLGFGQREQAVEEGEGREPGRDEARCHGAQVVVPESAEGGAQREADPEGRADQRHAPTPLLDGGHVGDVGERRGDRAAEQPGRDARDEQHREGVRGRLREREERVRHERAGQPDQEDGAPADPVGDPSPERREDELHGAEGGEQQAHGRLRRLVVLRVEREQRQDEPEAQQVDHHGQEDREQGGAAHAGGTPGEGGILGPVRPRPPTNLRPPVASSPHDEDLHAQGRRRLHRPLRGRPGQQGRSAGRGLRARGRGERGARLGPGRESPAPDRRGAPPGPGDVLRRRGLAGLGARHGSGRAGDHRRRRGGARARDRSAGRRSGAAEALHPARRRRGRRPAARRPHGHPARRARGHGPGGRRRGARSRARLAQSAVGLPVRGRARRQRRRGRRRDPLGAPGLMRPPSSTRARGSFAAPTVASSRSAARTASTTCTACSRRTSPGSPPVEAADACVLTPQGRLVGVPIVLHLGHVHWLDLDAQTVADVVARLERTVITEDVTFRDLGAAVARFALVGAGAPERLRALVDDGTGAGAARRPVGRPRAPSGSRQRVPPTSCSSRRDGAEAVLADAAPVDRRRLGRAPRRRADPRLGRGARSRGDAPRGPAGGDGRLLHEGLLPRAGARLDGAPPRASGQPAGARGAGGRRARPRGRALGRGTDRGPPDHGRRRPGPGHGALGPGRRGRRAGARGRGDGTDPRSPLIARAARPHALRPDDRGARRSA